MSILEVLLLVGILLFSIPVTLAAAAVLLSPIAVIWWAVKTCAAIKQAKGATTE